MTTVYMKIPGVTGDVTDKDHKGWIEVHNFQFSIYRNVETKVGFAANREVGHANVSNVSFDKDVDAASPQIASKALKGGKGDQIEIHFTNTDGVYEEITLTEAIISHLSKTAGREHLNLDFTKIEMAYTPRKGDNSNGSKQRVSYNLADAQTS